MNNELKKNRPAPHLIKFTEDCFKVVGTEKFYTVSRSALHSGPAHFTNKTEAEEFAKKTNRTVVEHTREVKERVKWF